MGRRKLSRCGGTCKEDSAIVEIYHPVKLEETIVFKRVAYCTNHGCGWRQKYPDIVVEAGRKYAGDSEAIKSYLRRTQKRFHIPNLPVKTIWTIWVRGWSMGGPLDFEEYLKELEGRSRG